MEHFPHGEEVGAQGKIPTRFNVTVRGITCQADDNDSFIRLLNVLFEAGFINARVPDPTKAKNFRHIMHPDDPNLTSLARWNDLQATRWEVHPAFRTWLLDAERAIPHRR